MLTVLAAPAAHAANWDASTTVRYVDLNDEPGVVDPQFSWDPIPGAAKYEVEVNSSNDWAVGSRVCCDEKAVGTSLSPLKLLPNNTYYWRVRAIDAAGNAGRWNAWCGNDVFPCDPPAGFDKTFDAVDPTIPKLHVRDSSGDSTPAGGPSGLPTTDAPVIAWDPVPGASSYEFKLAPWDASSGGFCNWTSPGGYTSTTATTAWTPLGGPVPVSPVGNAHPGVTTGGPILKDGTSYCVRVRARSDRDATNAEIVSDWTQIGGWGSAAFTYSAPTLPPCAATAMPASAYHDEPQKSVAAPRMPLFTWDRVAGACGYFVVIAKDPDFTKIVDVAFTTSPAYAPRTANGVATYTDETTSYYWAVMPSALANGDGVSTAPQQDHPQPFNKRSEPPRTLSPTSAVSGEPSFRWTAAEGAREYRIQVDDDQYFGTPLTDIVTDSTAYTSTTRYPVGTTLYWRVRADDENKVGLGWSPIQTFSARPPETYVNGPLISGASVSFTLSSNVGDAAFKCRLDGPGAKLGVLAPCGATATFGPLGDGSYVFTAIAADLAGNADATPETRAFRIDTTAPDTSIASGPPVSGNSRTATFAFASAEPGSTFACKLDGPGGSTGSWASCASPAQLAGLADGGYTFSVRATDVAGNTDPTPATYRFSIDTQAPDTVISSGPGATAAAGSVLFTFASEPGARFECRLDGPDGTSGGWAGCSSPSAYSGLGGGSYTFSVRAVDAARNADATPATWVFTLTPPSTPSSPFAAPPASVPATAPPTVKRLGAPTFPVPSQPIGVRAGTARLRFTCATADGCTAAVFVVKGRRPGFTVTLALKAGPAGSHLVTARFSRLIQRSLKRAGRRGLKVTVGRVGGATVVSTRLVARR